MERKLVFHAYQVMPFSPPEAAGAFESRLLVDRESVGSANLVVNHFTLKPGGSTETGKHPSPYDEVYYVLRGRGVVRLGEPPKASVVGPNTIVFIPNGTLHCLENTGTEDLEMLTIMPGPIVQGVNPVYDERLRTWGTSFRLAGG